MDRHKSKDLMLINLKLNRNVVDVLDRLVKTGLYKSRSDIMLAALRNYEPFKTNWKQKIR